MTTTTTTSTTTTTVTESTKSVMVSLENKIESEEEEVERERQTPVTTESVAVDDLFSESYDKSTKAIETCEVATSGPNEGRKPKALDTETVTAMFGMRNYDCGCSTVFGLTTESGIMVELMLMGSRVLNIYLALFPPLFCMVLEMGWLKAAKKRLVGNPGDDRNKGEETGKRKRDDSEESQKKKKLKRSSDSFSTH